MSHNHQITWISASHSHSDTLNCFFSFTIVQGFPNLDLLGAGQQWQRQWVCAAWAQVCPHCALETPASGSRLGCSLTEPDQLWLTPGSQQQLGCDGGEGVCTTETPPALGTGGSNSSGVQGNELWAPESLGWGRWWLSGVLVWVHQPKRHTEHELTLLCVCVCCCSSDPLPSDTCCLEPSLLYKDSSSSYLYAGQEKVSGEVFGA